METTAISGIINVILLAAPVFGTFAIFLIGALIWWRTGSAIMILERLWTLFHGPSKATTPLIKNYMESQAEAMRLRFSTGAKVRTLHHANRLIEWSCQNDESLTDAVACGPYFDFELPGLSKKLQPSITWMITLVTITMVLVFLALAAGIGTIPERALLKLNATGTWFTMNSISAKPFSSDPGFKLAECNEDHAAISRSSGFTKVEVSLLCNYYRNEDKSTFNMFLNDSIAEQRWGLGTSAGIAIFMAIPMLLSALCNSKALAMRKRLRARE